METADRIQQKYKKDDNDRVTKVCSNLPFWDNDFSCDGGGVNTDLGSEVDGAKNLSSFWAVLSVRTSLCAGVVFWFGFWGLSVELFSGITSAPGKRT